MDVFDFDDDQEVPSPVTSPVAAPKRTFGSNKKKSPSLPFDTARTPAEDSINTTHTSSQTSTSTSHSTNQTSDPLKGGGGRTRHARKRTKKQEEPVEEEEDDSSDNPNRCQENNGISPNRKVRFSRAQKKQKREQQKDDESASGSGESEQEDEDSETGIDSSVASSSILSNGQAAATKTIPPRQQQRKRRRKQAPPPANKATKPKLFSRLAATNNNSDNFFGKSSSLAFSTPAPPNANEKRTNNSEKSRLSLSEQIKQKLEQHERQQQKLCPSPAVVVSRKVRGAGGNVYAAQEVGQFQMLHDECHYWCSTIVACPLAQLPAKANIVESVSELAVLLSNTRTRRTLWSENDGTTTVEAILEVLRHTTTALAERSQHNKERFASLQQKLQIAAAEDDTQQKQPYHDHARMEPPHNHKNIVEEYYAGLLLDSLAAMVSFLSWDCTIDNKASAYYQSANGAQKLRQTILQHEGVLPAVLYIIRHADPVVASILEPTAQSIATEHHQFSSSPQLKLPPPESPPRRKQQRLSQQSDASSSQQQQQGSPSKHSEAASVISSQNDTDSLSSTITEDPTAVGRRKRRRRRGGGTALESIAEDASVALSFTGGGANQQKQGGGAMTPPRSPPRVVFHNPLGSDARTKLSFTTDDAMSPCRTPPRRGRGSDHNNEDRDDGSSLVSCDSTLLKIHDRLSTARSRFVAPNVNNKHPSRSNGNSSSILQQKTHDCQDHRELPLSFGGKDPAGSAAMLALGALRRLIAGKEDGDEHSCLDQIEEEDSSNHNFLSQNSEDHDDSMDIDMDGDQKPSAKMEDNDALQSNPLLQTNRMIGESGVIPFLAQGVAETLAATMAELENEDSKPCRACLQHLHEKFQGLATIVDGACLLHDDNRTDFCSATLHEDDTSDNGLLIGSLVVFLKTWLQQQQQMSSGGKGKANTSSSSLASLLGEMGMSALRTLTSLTHDNSLASEQLAIEYHNNNAPSSSKQHKKKAATVWSGVQIIGLVLHRAASKEEETKLIYDMRIFCLNTLANVVGDEPNGDIRRILHGLQTPPPLTTAAGLKNGSSSISNKKSTPLFLTWITRWLIGQTESFRDSIMKGSFGGTNGATTQYHSVRELEKHEDDLLNTAGNGCVLLACLLMDAPNAKTDKTMATITQRIREVILAEMPPDESTGLPSGTMFIKNTLRAFSNFLYFSMGDLSVAVVGPIRNLLDRLEKIQVEAEIVS